jgi:Tfp pilus assembly protein PilN
MLSLNLVSDELKKEIKLRHIYKLIKKIGYTFIITTIVISAVLTAAKIILKKNYIKIVEQTSLVNISKQSYASRVKEINLRLNAISEIQNNYISWADLLKYLSEKTPGKITLSFIKINKDNATLKIGGEAKTREDLLIFKENLENSKVFSDINLPLENILEKENISFEISAKINFKDPPRN